MPINGGKVEPISVPLYKMNVCKHHYFVQSSDWPLQAWQRQQGLHGRISDRHIDIVPNILGEWMQ